MPCSSAHSPMRAYLLGRVHRAGRVRRRDEQQHLRALGASRLELLDRDEVALVGAREDVDLAAARELDRLGVGGPVGRRDDHLVAVVEQHLERLVHGLLAAVRHDDLAGADLEARVAQRLRRHRLAQVGQAGRGRVAVVLRVVRGRERGLDDVLGRREVGLARRVRDDRAPLGLERLRPGVDLERRGLGDGGDTGGEAGVFGHPHSLGRADAPWQPENTRAGGCRSIHPPPDRRRGVSPRR